MSARRCRSASSLSADTTAIGTKRSGFTHDCVYLALMSSGFRPRAGASEASMPDSERICPVTTPTTPASTNVASSVPSRARIRPREVARRVIRTSRPAVRRGRIASGVQAIRHTALSPSPTSCIWSRVSREKSPTRSVWNVTDSGIEALRGSGEPFVPAGCVALPGSVISSAIRGSRSTKPAVVTCVFASSVRSAHIVW